MGKGLALALALLLVSSSVGAVTYEMAYSDLAVVDWDTIAAGTIIDITTGTYTSAIVILPIGTSGNEITIRPKTGDSPILESSLTVTDAAYATLSGLTIRDATFPAVILQTNSHHITITDCTLTDSGMGVWIKDLAGANNTISDNSISGSTTHGIAIDSVNCTVGNETTISGNTVQGSAQHGIEINGNFYIVDSNTVFGNGAGSVGTSGIHVFSASAAEPTGDNNIIQNNIIYGNKESDGPDGNGVQLDQWCDNNTIYNNTIYSNDGAGISVFDSANDSIDFNTVTSNMLDPGGSHLFKGEVVLYGSVAENAVDNIVFSNNVVVAGPNGNVAIYIGPRTALKTLEIGNNQFYHKNNDNFYFWSERPGNDINRWNGLAAGFGDDTYENPNPPCN